MPRLQFENKITLSGLIQIGLLVVAIVGGYFTMVNKIDSAATEIVGLKEADATIRKEAAELRVQVSDDRLTTRETLAELKTDVGYIRRYVEEERRGARP